MERHYNSIHDFSYSRGGELSVDCNQLICLMPLGIESSLACILREKKEEPSGLFHAKAIQFKNRAFVFLLMSKWFKMYHM